MIETKTRASGVWGIMILAGFAALAGPACAEDDQRQNPFSTEFAVVPTLASTDPAPRVISAFAGCPSGSVPPVRAKDGSARRVLATLGEEGAEADPACWTRIDGIWRVDREITHLGALAEELWTSDDKALLRLAHAKHRRPKLLSIMPSETGDRLWVFDALDPEAFTYFVSQDAKTIEEVLQTRGEAKVFKSVAHMQSTLPSSHSPKILRLDVTASGRMRIVLDGETFYRPGAVPRAGQCSDPKQFLGSGIRDAWIIPLTLENLGAARRGYDVATQDSLRILDNPKSFLFQLPTDTSYCVYEKRMVPFGWSLLPNSLQGTVYSKTLVTSGREMQRVMGSSFGFNVGVERGDPTKANDMVSVSYGQNSSNEAISGMKNSKQVAQAVAYSRQVQFTLVANDGLVRLTPSFTDLVYDAASAPEGNMAAYDAIIRKFGTHFPYAVAYGANARMTQSFTLTEYENLMSQQDYSSEEASVSVFGIGGSANTSELSGKTTGTKGSFADDKVTFVAVGGNGSWDQLGYSAGVTPYPIQLDARSIDTLLTPLNFPDDPDIYNEVRIKLRARIDAYLEEKAGLLTAESLAPDMLSPKEWTYGGALRDLPGSNEKEGKYILEFTRVTRNEVEFSKLDQTAIDHGMTLKRTSLNQFGGRLFGNWESVLTVNPDGTVSLQSRNVKNGNKSGMTNLPLTEEYGAIRRR